MSVDEIGYEADFVQTADDGHCRGAELVGNRTQSQAERHGAMAPANQCAADIANPELRAGPLAQRVVGEEIERDRIRIGGSGRQEQVSRAPELDAAGR